MEQEGPRIRFNKVFSEYISTVRLSPQFMNLLRTHPCEYMLDDVNHFRDETAKKCRIFGEFTRERDHCSKLADILEESGQLEAANQLREYNTSEKPWKYKDIVDLQVVKAITLRSNNTRYYKMEGRQRGRALIFVTIDVLCKEAQRFESILKQMYFEVEIYPRLTADQIEAVLEVEANHQHEGEAFIVMFIGHGGDERIKGYGERPGDELAIKKIVDKFSEKNCASLKNKPKVFVFNCCRTKEEETPLPAVFKLIGSQIVIDMKTIDMNWKNDNQRTYIVYACAEGTPSWYYPCEGFTQFGQAFSHTIAQFSWYKNLAELLLKTQSRLEKELGREQRPEIRLCCVERELYFNPGLVKQP